MGTYRVMVRERNRRKLVRGAQAGEISGVGLQQERNSQSMGPARPLTKLREAGHPHAALAPSTSSRSPEGTSLCSSDLLLFPGGAKLWASPEPTRVGACTHTF